MDLTRVTQSHVRKTGPNSLHFRSRDDIVDALMVPVIQDTEQAVARIGAMPVSQRPDAARRFYARFVVTHRAIISTVFFDRPALRPQVAQKVDELVTAVAALLAGAEQGTVGNVWARTLIYGLAAVVAESPQHNLDDSALLALVERVARVTEDEIS